MIVVNNLSKSDRVGVDGYSIQIIKPADDKFLVSNYRPVSILPVFLMVFGKLLHTRFINIFIDKYNLVHNNQYGFREYHSKYIAFLTTLDQIFQKMNSKKCSICVFSLIKSI